MTLVDTSVWVAHFRERDPELQRLLEACSVFTHPLVIGELACGNLRDRARILQDFSHLERATVAQDDEVHELLESKKLFGRGLGWMDVSLLASALLDGCALWTLDTALHQAANEMRVRTYSRALN